MNKTLPTELTYMQPFIDYLESLEPEKIDESVDINLLNLAIKQRVKGLSIAEAKKLLMEDKTILDKWLENSEHVALFISAYIDVSDEFIKIVRKTKIAKTNKITKTVKFTATAPDGFEVDKFKNSMMFTKTDIEPAICVIHLSIPNKTELNALSALEDYLQKTKITTPKSEIDFYEWAERKNYEFIKEKITFILRSQSYNYALNKNIALKIIDSIDISH